MDALRAKLKPLHRPKLYQTLQPSTPKEPFKGALVLLFLQKRLYITIQTLKPKPV